MLLLTTLANVATQAFLWGVLTRFYDHYLLALFTAEAILWTFEAAVLCLCLLPRRAVTLSLLMNAASFAIGWFLPV